MDAVKELKRLSTQIAQAKEDAANAKGQMDLLLSDIKAITNTDTLEDAEAVVADWEEELSKYPSKIESMIREIKDEFGL